jgi:radical SAM superfamily enzyme YgiQ (UPF0313 family)
MKEREKSPPGESGFHVLLTALYGTENAGVRYLSARLKKDGFRVSVAFFREWRNNANTLPDEKDTALFLDLVDELAPDLVGFSFISSFFSIAAELTGRVKERTGKPVVWGGIHATACPEECLKHADYVCMGEGEEPLSELAGALAAGLAPAGLANICTKKDGLAIKNPLRNLMPDLDLLPYPDYGDEGKFLVDGGRVHRGDPVVRGAEYRVYSSRGCPFACSYCYNSILREAYRGKGIYHRHRSPAHVIGELEQAMAIFPRLRKIKFDDDTAFCFGRDWLEEFCRLYREKIKIPFECMINPELIREDTLTLLKDAGLVKVQAGIEAASEGEAREVFGRAPSAGKIMEFARMNRRLKLDVVYDVIIDNPLSTGDDKRALFDFLLGLPGPYKLYLYSLVVFPGTPLCRQLLEKGVITEDDVEGKSTKALRQFRVSLDWPRPARDRFYLALYVLVSKGFVPRSLLRWLSRNEGLQERPGGLMMLAGAANALKMAQVGLEMLARGELTPFKLRQYGDLRRMISQ